MEHTIIRWLVFVAALVPLSTSLSSRIDCTQPAAKGTCLSGLRPRFKQDDSQFWWYFDAELRRCNVFLYSGCGGNSNRFRTSLDCSEACERPGKIQNRLAAINRIRFVNDETINNRSGLSSPFEFHDYNSSELPFPASPKLLSTEIEKQKTTVVDQSLSADDEICTQLEDSGYSCSENESPKVKTSDLFANKNTSRTFRRHTQTRFYWHPLQKKCSVFEYAGCGGNSNNFNSRSHCQLKCDKGFGKEISEADVDRLLFEKLESTSTQSSKLNGNEFSRTAKSTAVTAELDISEQTIHVGINYSTETSGDDTDTAADEKSNLSDFMLSSANASSLQSSVNNMNTTLTASIRRSQLNRAARVPKPSYRSSLTSGGTQSSGHNSSYNATLKRGQIGQALARTPNLPRSAKCLLRMQRGFCDRSINRWAYQSILGKCVRLNYRGCGGNQNNFLSKSMCEYHCKRE